MTTTSGPVTDGAEGVVVMALAVVVVEEEEGAMEAAAELAIKLSNEFEKEKNILPKDQHDQLKKISKSG